MYRRNECILFRQQDSKSGFVVDLYDVKTVWGWTSAHALYVSTLFSKVEQRTIRTAYDKNQNCLLIHVVLYSVKSVIFDVIPSTLLSFQQTGQKIIT
jgi:hypothetical protein